MKYILMIKKQEEDAVIEIMALVKSKAMRHIQEGQ